jgi:hypothetical protein
MFGAKGCWMVDIYVTSRPLRHPHQRCQRIYAVSAPHIAIATARPAQAADLAVWQPHLVLIVQPIDESFIATDR